jgi:hypothetical protein
VRTYKIQIGVLQACLYLQEPLNPSVIRQQHRQLSASRYEDHPVLKDDLFRVQRGVCGPRAKCTMPSDVCQAIYPGAPRHTNQPRQVKPAPMQSSIDVEDV